MTITSSSSHLLSPFDLRGLPLRNRVVMAPLTRGRAGRERVPNDRRGVARARDADFLADLASGAGVAQQLPRRAAGGVNGWELNPPADVKVWSAPTAEGYTDFPSYPRG